MREPAPYPIAIEGHEEIKQLVEPRFHPHTPFGRYEAIEPHMDGTDRTYSAVSKMRADGCALAYETFAVVFLVVIPEGDLLFRCTMDEWTSTERLSVPKLRRCAPQDHISALPQSRPPTRTRQRLTGQK